MRKLTADEIRAQLDKTDGWELTGDAITRRIECRSFPEAMLFINAVAHLAEQANHHPEIRNVYKWVTLALSTHDADGLTAKDFRLARRINRLL
jgi:4a-hydroxytetrahydrobiopterin dehydratase